MLIGFAAQLVDGALGMAYGQISSTLLISMGVPPAAASAGVHTAETFTTAVSGISHVAHRNVDWRLFFRIVVPGVIGGVLGAYVLTQIDADTAKPIVLTYLTALGLYLFYRGVMHRHTERQPKVVAPLGLVGGFLDAAGGGGWGAIVTSNLLVQGSNPRKTIRQHRRGLPDRHHLGDLHCGSGLGGVHYRHARTADRRRVRRAVRRNDREKGEPGYLADLRRRAGDADQPLRPLPGAHLGASAAVRAAGQSAAPIW
jgi:hypothetical protein